MKYIMTIVWAILISATLSYVLANMAGDSFVLAEAGILAAILAVFIFILGDVVIKSEKE